MESGFKSSALPDAGSWQSLIKDKNIKTSGSFKIDVFLNKNLEFWKDLEIHCLVECCGIDAFALDKENIQRTIINHNELDIKNNLEELIKQIDNSKFEKISSYLFSLTESKKIFKNRIKEILKAL